jgi:predicted alpha/beta-fold hydrolase
VPRAFLSPCRALERPDRALTVVDRPQRPPTPLPACSWTTARFDEYVTLKNLGFETPSDYYRHACVTNYLPHLATPCLYLVARDDPFLGCVIPGPLFWPQGTEP